MVIDLTQMLGSAIADYIYSLEQSTAGAGAAWFREYFASEFYPYDSGTLKSVEGVSAHITTGFNQWDEVAEVGSINNSTGQNANAQNNNIASSQTQNSGASATTNTQNGNLSSFINNQ